MNPVAGCGSKPDVEWNNMLVANLHQLPNPSQWQIQLVLPWVFANVPFAIWWTFSICFQELKLLAGWWCTALSILQQPLGKSTTSFGNSQLAGMTYHDSSLRCQPSAQLHQANGGWEHIHLWWPQPTMLWTEVDLQPTETSRHSAQQSNQQWKILLVL